MPVVRPYPGIARCLRRGVLAALCAWPLLGTGCASTKIGLQGDGSYGLETGEQGMDCQRLSNSIWGRLQVLKAMPDRVKSERAAVASNFVQVVGRMFGGSSKGLDTLKEYDRERAHLRALHRLMLDKGCMPIDIERELAVTDAAIAPYRN